MNQEDIEAKELADKIAGIPPDDDRRFAKVHIFKGADGQHYWRRVAVNGQVVATGAEGYLRLADCIYAAERENQGLEIIESVE